MSPDTRFEVIAPLVVVRSAGRVVYKARGQQVDGLTAADAARLTAKGMIAELGDQPVPTPATPATPSPEPEPARADADVLDRPKKAATHTAWVTYAVASGQLDRAQAEAMTRAEIIAAVR